jgi:hypothetical protein
MPTARCPTLEDVLPPLENRDPGDETGDAE